MDSLLHDIEGMLRRNRAVSLKTCETYKVEKKVRVRNGIKRTVYSATIVETVEPKKVVVEAVVKTKDNYLALCNALENDAWKGVDRKNLLDRYYALDHEFNNTQTLEQFNDDDAIAVCEAFAMAQMTIEKCLHTIL